MALFDRGFDVSVVPVARADLSPQALREVEQFLYQEARLLDERRLQDWLALWDPQGRYWVPREHGQADPFDHVSLFWEDRVLREVRVRRLAHARSWSQQPPTRSVRLVGNVSIEGRDAAGHLIVRSCLVCTEWRREQRQLAGTVHHKLVPADGDGWRIRLKRVDLVNCDDMFDNLEVFL